jgi:hypothetical protein
MQDTIFLTLAFIFVSYLALMAFGISHNNKHIVQDDPDDENPFIHIYRRLGKRP